MTKKEDREMNLDLAKWFEEKIRQAKYDAWWRGAPTVVGLTGSTHLNLTNPYEKEENA